MHRHAKYMVYVYMQFVYISCSENVDNQVNIIIRFQENNTSLCVGSEERNLRF